MTFTQLASSRQVLNLNIPAVGADPFTSKDSWTPKEQLRTKNSDGQEFVQKQESQKHLKNNLLPLLPKILEPDYQNQYSPIHGANAPNTNEEEKSSFKSSDHSSFLLEPVQMNRAVAV
mmetsp:Transcript_12177/g.18819  ORF Transcript_12177/g.18819 Transcript_12177/m.18819 type:complete len:118 (+) Transcript_12177:1144-1497(+)